MTNESTTQTATVVHPETGEVLVLVRLGAIEAALTIEGAAALAESLKVEAAFAKIHAARLAQPVAEP